MFSMKSFRHWTPRYLARRLQVAAYEYCHPTLPWLTQTAVSFLADYLRPQTDIGIEWGSGRSTVWFSKYLRHLTSIEHDEKWYQQITERLKHAGCQNVDYRLSTMAISANPTLDEIAAYLKPVACIADSSLDFALVDGMARDHCALTVLPKLKPGGLLVIDNVNWYLPSETNAPSSRRFKEGPATPIWATVWEAIKDWRRYWTSNGIADTAMFFKPING
jgi:predicted O-methyltransferase YrrM